MTKIHNLKYMAKSTCIVVKIELGWYSQLVQLFELQWHIQLSQLAELGWHSQLKSYQ